MGYAFTSGYLVGADIAESMKAGDFRWIGESVSLARTDYSFPGHSLHHFCDVTDATDAFNADDLGYGSLPPLRRGFFIQNVLSFAASKDVDVLVLGAFGYDTFRNDPAAVARGTRLSCKRSRGISP